VQRAAAISRYMAKAVTDVQQTGDQLRWRTVSSESGAAGDLFGRLREHTLGKWQTWTVAVQYTSATSFKYGPVRDGQVRAICTLSADLLASTVRGIQDTLTALSGQLAGGGPRAAVQMQIGCEDAWRAVMSVTDVSRDDEAGLVTLVVELQR
jgi:hypothetical protein